MKYMAALVLLIGFVFPVYAGGMDDQGLICNKQGGYGKTYLTPIFFEHGVVKDVVLDEFLIEKQLVGEYAVTESLITWRHFFQNDEFSERSFDRGTSRLSDNRYIADDSDPVYSEWECQVTDWVGIDLYMWNEIEKLKDEMEDGKI